MERHKIQDQYQKFGFAIINEVYSEDEIEDIIELISKTDDSEACFKKSEELYAIRQFFKKIPEAVNRILNQKLLALIESIFGAGYFVTKSIYFDKPEKSNWFVAWHQDLTISVDKKCEVAGFGPWTIKQDQFAVQPPLNLLESNFTIRVHLDDTTKENGALKVIPSSHKKGIYRANTIDWSVESENICEVRKRGIMIMSPLLLHSSGRTINHQRRRVIHIECSKAQLPKELQWSEFLPLMLPSTIGVLQ